MDLPHQLRVLMLELTPNSLDHHLQEALTLDQQQHHHLLLKAHMGLLHLLKAHMPDLTLNNQDLLLQKAHILAQLANPVDQARHLQQVVPTQVLPRQLLATLTQVQVVSLTL
jgi:hypothetical protein